ncbi:hypothetical protein PVAG01_00129 [Phlyctema vagabunda]|uniref:DUF2470 domain-containing protein n=1 Tax=Phlyctema vagabunda TaxID=108571 RepID=A0ABR4PTR3_9HELO
MADQASKDAAAKTRIITHMNNDHQTSLSYYLQHYHSLSSRAASKAQLKDITFDSMTLQTADSKTYTIPFEPAMSSWGEARPRVVEMDREARKGLDISSISITEYERPRKPFHIAVFAICLNVMVLFLARSRIVPGTFLYDSILPYFPGGPTLFLKLTRTFAIPTLLIHIVESYILDRTRLRKYNVPRGSGLWYKWMASCFIEGFACFARIDATVKRKTAEAEKAKH